MSLLRFLRRWFLRLAAAAFLIGVGVIAFHWTKYRPRCVIVCKTHHRHLSDDGNFIISASPIDDNQQQQPHLQNNAPFHVWDTRTGAVVHTLLDDVAGAEFYNFSKDDRHFMAYLGKGIARLVDWRTAQEWDIVVEHASDRTGFTFAPGGDWFYVYDPGQQAPHLLIDVAKHQIVVRLEGNQHQAHGFSPSEDRFYFWKDKRLQAWNTQTRQIDGSFAIPTPMLFDKQGRRLIASAADGTSLVVWDTTTFKPLATIKPSPSESKQKGDQAPFALDGPAWIDWPCDVVFSPSGNLVATFPKSGRESPAGVLEFWEANTGRKLSSVPLNKGSFGSHFVNDASFLSHEPGIPGHMLWRMGGVNVPCKLIDAAAGRVVWDDSLRWGDFRQLNESVLIRLDDPSFLKLIDANTAASISTIAHPFDSASRQHGLMMARGIRTSSYDLQEPYLCIFGKCRKPELPTFLEKWLARWVPAASGAVYVIDRKTCQVAFQMHIGADDWAFTSKDGTTLMIYTELLDEGVRPPPDKCAYQYRFHDLHSVKPWIWAVAIPTGIVMLALLWRRWRSGRAKRASPVIPAGG